MEAKCKCPNTWFKWIILLCSFINQMGTVGLMISLSVLYVSWLEEFQEGKASTSWILSLGCALNLAFCPVPASLAARFGFRAVGFIGALLTSAGLVMSAFATSVSFVIVSVGFIAGVGCSFSYLPSVAMVAIYFEKRRSMAIGIAITGVGVGSFVLAPLLNYLEETYTWRGALLILGGITLNMCVTALLFRPIETASDVLVTSNDQYHCSKEGGAEDSEMNYENPKIHIEDFGVSGNTNSTSDHIYPCEENTTLIDDFQIKAGSRESICDEHERICYHLRDGCTQAGGGDENLPGDINNLLIKSKPNLTTHISLNDVRSKDLQVPCISLPDLYLRQKQKSDVSLRQKDRRFHLLRSLQNVDLIVSTSMQGFNRLVDDFEKEERPCHTNSEDINQSIRDKKTSIQNKSLWSKFLSSTAVKTNLDILNDKIFVLFCISNFIACLSFYTPVIFLVDRAVHEGIDKSIGAILISANGCGNILGRISTGWLADCCCTNRMLMFIVALIAQGVGTILSSLCGGNMILHGIYAIYLGYLMGVYTILAPLVTVDLKGVSNIATAYGLVLTFKGTGSVIGPPISGLLFDWTKSYSLSYIANGVFLIISAVIIMPLLCKHHQRGDSET